MNKVEKEKVYGLLNDLGLEYQTMSGDEITLTLLQTQSTLNTLYKMMGVANKMTNDRINLDYMIKKTEGYLNE